MAAKCSATTTKGARCTRWALPGTTCCGVHTEAHGDGQPRFEDGTVDVRALCERWDTAANRGAGEARTCGAYAVGKLTDNRNDPGDVSASPGPAETTGGTRHGA